MMPLRLMTSITSNMQDGESSLANQIATVWDHDAGSVRFFRSSANFLFTLDTDGERRFLRFNHADERKAHRVQGELDFQIYLANQGLYVPRPLRSKAGNFVESVETDDGTFHAVLFEGIEGDQPELDDLTSDQFGTWGNTLGRFHKTAQKYCGEGRPTWQDQFTWVERNLPKQEEEARAAAQKLSDALTALPILPDNFGLIHYDFELDNVIWGERGLGIVDFDDCEWNWLVADVAYALRDLADDSANSFPMDDARFTAFLDGYRAEKKLTEEALALIPMFLHAHHLVLFTKLSRALNLEQQPDEAAWVTNLRQRLKHMMQQYRDEFTAYVQ